MPCPPLHNELFICLCEYSAGEFVFSCWEFVFRRSHCFPVLTPLSLSTLLSTINCLSFVVFFGMAAFLTLLYLSCVRGVVYLELGVVEELFKYFFSNSRMAAELRFAFWKLGCLIRLCKSHSL